MSRLPTLCLLLAAVVAPAAESIPADCRWVVSCDAAAIATGGFGGWIRDRLGDGPAADGLAQLEDATGFAPLRDLRRVTICAAADGEASGLILARGVFDSGRITDAIGYAENHATTAAGARTIHTWSDHGRPAAGCLAGGGLLVLGRSAERVGQALEALDAGATPALAPPPGWEDGAIAVAVADGIDALAIRAPRAAWLAGLRSATARVSETGGRLVLEAEAVAADAATAKRLAEAGNGLRAIVALAKPADLDPALAAALREGELRSDGARLHLRIALPVADATRLADRGRPAPPAAPAAVSAPSGPPQPGF